MSHDDPKKRMGISPGVGETLRIVREQEALRRVALTTGATSLIGTPAWKAALEPALTAARIVQDLKLDRFSELHRTAIELPGLMDVFRQAAELRSALPAFAPSLLALKPMAPLLGASFAPVPALNVLRQDADLLGTRLAEQMGLIGVAWANLQHPELSFAGFARLTSVADMVRVGRPFAPDVGEFVADALGEGGGSVGPDAGPTARDAAAVDAGLDPDLIAFPEIAYPQVTLSAGFRLTLTKDDPRIALVAGVEGASVDPENDRILKALENHLRDLVAKTLSQEDGGEAWIKKRVPKTVRDEWERKKEIAVARGGLAMPLVYYADLMHLHDIIIGGGAWPLFEALFSNRVLFTASMQRLSPIRHASAHGRAFSNSEVLTILTEGSRLLIAMGVARLGAH